MESTNGKGTGKFAETVEKLIGHGTPAGNFLESMKNRMGIGSPERNSTDTYERGMKIVPECIGAVENETPVKQYNIAVLRTLLKLERAEGRMQVTNKRVVFRAAGRSVGGRTTLQHEFAINEIAGIEAKKNFKFSFLYLLFAVFISALAVLIIYGPEGITGIKTPLETQEYRIERILSPKHLRAAYLNAEMAIEERAEAEGAAEQAKSERDDLQQLVAEYEENARVNPNRTHWFRRQNRTAQAVLDLIIPEKDAAVEKAKLANEQLASARAVETEAVKKLESAEKTWAVLMTVLGTLLGLGALFAFFALYKKFGLKLFILHFGIFGFALSFAVTDFFLFKWLLVLTAIITLICVFLYCFRPNLVVSIKNKSGKEGAMDIRRGKGTGFAEVIPTEESEGAIREIGAMISDIQKSGDSAIGKWSNK
jgi:hypothetical protein